VPADFLHHPDSSANATAEALPHPGRPLNAALMLPWEEDATTIDPSTIVNWNKLTYTVGDRLVPDTGTRSRRRLPRQEGGFPCPHDGCLDVFDRQCDLT
jgi:hypothetical protein